MSDKKQKLPRPALRLRLNYARSGKSYSDSIAVEACTVLRIEGENAVIAVRVGRISETRVVPVADLASTAAKAIAKLQAHFAALLSRPLLTAPAGMTESNAAANSSV